MSKNPFVWIAEGATWLGKEIVKPFEFLNKAAVVLGDVESAASTTLPEGITVLSDAGNLALAVVKDGGAALLSAGALLNAIEAAAEADALDVTKDTAVVAAFESFVTIIKASGTWSDVLNGVKTLVADVDKFGAAAEAAAAKIVADAK